MIDASTVVEILFATSTPAPLAANEVPPAAAAAAIESTLAVTCCFVWAMSSSFPAPVTFESIMVAVTSAFWGVPSTR